MTLIKITLAALMASTVFNSVATAEETIDTTFVYDANLSADGNYRAIQRTAAAACEEIHPDRATSFPSAYLKTKQKCRSEMIEAAIEAFDQPQLTAVHTGNEPRPLTLASID